MRPLLQDKLVADYVKLRSGKLNIQYMRVHMRCSEAAEPAAASRCSEIFGV